MPIVTLNVYSSISKHFYENNLELKKYNSTILLTLPMLACIFVGILYLLPKSIHEDIDLTRDVLYAAIVTSSLGAAIVYTGVLFRLKRKPFLYGKYHISQSTFLLILMLAFSYYKPDYKMLVIAKTTHVFVLFIASIVLLYLNKDFLFKYNITYLTKAIRLSFPTVIYSLSAFIFVMSDRLLITHFYGPKELGYYAAISQIAAAISILTASFNAAWMPWLFENLKKNSKEVNLSIVRLSYLLMFLFLVLGLLFCLVYPIIARLILTEEFYPYISASYLIILALSFQGVYLIVSPYVFYSEKTKYNALIGVCVAIINVSLNIILIPKYNIWGASISYFISWLSLSIFFFYYSSKFHPMPWFERAVFDIFIKTSK